MAGLFDLSGRVAVVTGGNGGIGLGIAEGLAQHGCAISIWGRNAEKNALAAAKIEALGGRVETRVCDVASRDETDAATQATLASLGRIDGVFANAGVSSGGRRAFIERTDEDWHNVLTINLDDRPGTPQPRGLPPTRGVRMSTGASLRVLAGDAELAEAQVGGQFGDVAGHRGGVVAGQGALGAAGAPVVDRDDGAVGVSSGTTWGQDDMVFGAPCSKNTGSPAPPIA